MRSVRVIPCLDVDAGRVVKGVRFVDLVDAGDPVELAAALRRRRGRRARLPRHHRLRPRARHHGRRGGPHGRARCSSPSPWAAGCAAPTTPGACCGPGPTRWRSTPRPSLDPELVRALADEFGVQCVVVAIDARRRGRRDRAGRSSPTAGARRPGTDAVAWAERVRRHSAPARSCSPRWTATAPATGFDLELTRAVVDAVGVPVVASGGVGTLDHLVEGAVGGRRRRRAGGVDLPPPRAHRGRGQGVPGGPRRGACGRPSPP